MTSPPQHLVILWKWRHLGTPNDDAYQALPVYGAGGKQVLHQLHQRGKSDLLPLLQQFMTKDSDGEYLLMLHQSAFSRANLNELLRSLSNQTSLRAHFFGGGSDYLYYDSNRNSGLLEQHGELAHRKYFGGTRGPDMLIDNELDPLRFRQIWRHYYYQCKRGLFDLRQDVLRHLTGCVLLLHQTGTTSVLLKTTHPALLDRLQKVLQHITEQYVNEEGDAISQLLGTLHIFLEEQEISEAAHVHKLNTLLANLLDIIHEPVY